MNLIKRLGPENAIYFIGELSGNKQWRPGDAHPLIHFADVPMYVIAPQGSSREELRRKLLEMLQACEGPLFILEPERVMPVQLTKAPDA